MDIAAICNGNPSFRTFRKRIEIMVRDGELHLFV